MNWNIVILKDIKKTVIMNTGTRSYLYIPVIMYLSNFILQADFKQNFTSNYTIYWG